MASTQERRPRCAAGYIRCHAAQREPLLPAALAEQALQALKVRLSPPDPLPICHGQRHLPTLSVPGIRERTPVSSLS